MTHHSRTPIDPSNHPDPAVPVLWQLEISHYVEKVRWALDYKHVAHIRHTLPPGLHAMEAERLTGDTSTVPVLFLSARDTEIDKVVGLEIGGDDYLAKPFGIRELIARVKALLRRSAQREATNTAHDHNEVLEASGITLDESTHMAAGPHGSIDLTPREFELLAALMRHAGKVMSRDQLLHEAWGWEYLVETKTVDTHVKRLRDKLEAARVDSSLVETVRGYGYRFKLA